MSHNGQVGVYFLSLDGKHRLLGTLFLAKGNKPKPTVLLCHGMPGIEKNYDIALMLRDHGWNSLIFHYQGCWGSEGVFRLETLPEDVIATTQYLVSGAHPQVDADRLVAIGHSMGGWSAILAAVSEPRLKHVLVYGAVAIPSELPFDKPNFAEQEFTPWLPQLSVEDFIEQWQGLYTENYETPQLVKQLSQSLTIIHGEADSVVPISQAEKVYEASQEGTKLIRHPEANHSFTWHRDWLLDRVREWIDQCTWN